MPQISLKVAKSIELLYELNRFLPETIINTLYTSLIHPHLSYGIDYRGMAWNISKLYL